MSSEFLLLTFSEMGIACCTRLGAAHLEAAVDRSLTRALSSHTQGGLYVLEGGQELAAAYSGHHAEGRRCTPEAPASSPEATLQQARLAADRASKKASEASASAMAAADAGNTGTGPATDRLDVTDTYLADIGYLG